ncbi:hypothetical protein AMJ52_03620 [candidate division TA06 bacterium DG_78]|uniref:Secretion system C-terminal sorting domain-containing protein n=1 Tax=candidate division TA06 bacterium DG_78 TaxID=1703772 RepID=A0A0S7YH08_UNCT6|nr:MAG: hypothetical protein AMJ52_03620 [candidate division TA06 bacterium DG_78]
MPTPRYGYGIGVVANKIYVIGGYNDSIILDEVEVYDPIANNWDTISEKLPTPRYDVGSAVYDGKIYIIGGRTGPYSNTSVIERFDPMTHTWDTVRSLPEPRAALGACVYVDYIFAVGGYHWDSLLVYYENKVEYYAPTWDSGWYRADSLNIPRSNLGVTVFNNRIYALGGNYYGPLNSMEFYVFDNWGITEPMFHSRSGVGVASYGDHIYAIGGEDDSIILSSVDVFYGQDSTWIAGPPLNQARTNFGVAIVSDTIYVIGGHGRVNVLNSMEYHPLPLTGIDESETLELEPSYLFPTHVRKGTTIDFAAGDVIKVYNSIGALVVEDKNSIRMDLPEGIYFIRLHRRNYPVVTHKIIVVR